MNAFGESIAGTEHEQGARQHTADIVSPHGRRDEGIPCNHLVNHGAEHGYGEPADGSPDHEAKAIDDGDDSGHPRRHIVGQITR